MKKLAGILILSLLLAAWTVGAAWAGKTINKKGSQVDVTSHLVPGKINIVQFHLPSNRMSKKLGFELEQFEKKNEGNVVHLTVDVFKEDSPVAKQYNLTSFPYFIIYDAKGQVDKEGPDAFLQVTKWVSD